MPPTIRMDTKPWDALLADGTTVRIRPICPDDAELLADFHATLSPESVYLRYFSAHPHLRPEELFRFTHVDGRDRQALVALVRDAIVGVARYDRLPDRRDEAEVAFVVADAYQGKGIATLLLEHLASWARSVGIDRFLAETLLQNIQMMEVFRHAGFEVESSLDQGIVHVSMDIRPTPAYLDAVDVRDSHASVESVRHLLRPASVAVIGAGAERGGIGHEILRNIIDGGYMGAVYPVRLEGGTIAGLHAYPSVLDVPGEVGMAVIAVPPNAVLGVVEECAAKKVHSLVVITAGFAEAGRGGKELQAILTSTARQDGMRVVGPNCMGVINTSPDVSLNATFAPVPPDTGRVAFASQSGGLGIAVLQEARRRHIGLSSFVSVGNKADISGNDLLLYWREDPQTDVILMYLESLGNPRRFARIARKVSATKPIVAVKAGRTRSGRRAASSHTAAMASSDAAVDALFRQSGVVRVDTLEEMFDTAQVLSDQPVPAGRRVAIISNAGGPAILAADTCEAEGLVVPELTAESQAALRTFLPSTAATTNPVDMIASASASDYRRAIEIALTDGSIDAVLAVFVPPLVTKPEDVAAAVSTAAKHSSKPVVANFLGMSDSPEALRTSDGNVPSFCFPEPAVRALARACGYGEWRERDPGNVPQIPDVNATRARALVSAHAAGHPDGRWLEPEEISSVLDDYGIPYPAFGMVRDADQAVRTAVRIGLPVALKAVGPKLLHKTELGGVRLGLDTPDSVRSAFNSMAASLGESMDAAMVQAMAAKGVECIVGSVHDPAFGPLVMFGTGGTAVELFADRAFRMLPLTDHDARELVRSLKGSPLLFGHRGSAAADVAALEELLLRVGRLAADVPELLEMDMNPVICGPWGVSVVDVRMRIGAAAPPEDDTVRRLR